LETIYCWSKFVDEDRLEEWEIRFIAEEIAYVVDKPVRRKRWRFCCYFTRQIEAEEMAGRFGGVVTAMVPADWQPKIPLDGGPPIRIRDTLLVTLTDDPDSLAKLERENPGRVILSFPPQLAFGTGEHPTTANCLRFLSDFAKERAGRPWRVLDLGCGSGILAIAAAKLGATEVIAVENDGMALEYASINGERHGVRSVVQFVEADAIKMMHAAPEKPFDLIAANLFSDLLVELFPLFPPHLTANSAVIVSGFLVTQREIVSDAAARAGLPLTDLLRRGKWMAGRTAEKNAPSQIPPPEV
jgi:ribosomal protein L11 methyltransferase